MPVTPIEMMHTAPIRLLYLSAGPARNTTSGALLMHRHFSLLPDRFEVHCAHEGPALPNELNYTELPPRRFFNRLTRTRLTDFVRGLDYSRGFFYSQRRLREVVRRVRPDAIVTVAESSFYHAARHAARLENIPLVTLFHDWSPGWPDIPRWSRPITERAFRRTYQESAFAFCISEELRTALGPKANSALLLPIPDPHLNAKPTTALAGSQPFFALYAGAFSHLYADEMKELCRELIRRGQRELVRVIGPDPRWPESDARLLRDAGIYAGFHKGKPFHDWLERAPALLVISPFAPDFALYARYSFPSKIPEYCRYGRPVVVWGPAYAASVCWGRRTGAALVVEDPSAATLVTTLEKLSGDTARQEQLAGAANTAAHTDFNPQRLQAIFEQGLLRAIGEPVGRAFAAS